MTISGRLTVSWLDENGLQIGIRWQTPICLFSILGDYEGAT